nr:MAG TPA: hypothetical protein [Caudoviricetes sp.]
MVLIARPVHAGTRKHNAVHRLRQVIESLKSKMIA